MGVKKENIITNQMFDIESNIANEEDHNMVLYPNWNKMIMMKKDCTFNKFGLIAGSMVCSNHNTLDEYPGKTAA